jgi:hypothetical protein
LELLKALGKGVFDSLLGVPRMLRKRRRVMETRRLPMAELSRLLRAHRITFKTLLDND